MKAIWVIVIIVLISLLSVYGYSRHIHKQNIKEAEIYCSTILPVLKKETVIEEPSAIVVKSSQDVMVVVHGTIKTDGDRSKIKKIIDDSKPPVKVELRTSIK